MTLTYASTFTGIGGFEVAFHQHGWKAALMSELEKDRRALLARHFPAAPIQGDIRDVAATSLDRFIDLFVGGFPCKEISVGAPHRAGLAGARSGLYYEFVRLLAEYLRLVEHARPRWVVIENTPGLLSSNGGRDMAAVVDGLEQLGYGWAFRTVDSRHLTSPAGIVSPQRRPRVIVVGHRGGDPRPAWQVLGDAGPGGEAVASHRIGGGSRRPGPVASASGDLVVWRKSARARAALSKGGYETWVQSADSNTLTGFDSGLATRQTHLLAQNGRLRTLTLTEWERLAGFPDDWTAGMADSARAAALGDSFHPASALWLAGRIEQAHNAIPQIGYAS